MTLQVTLRLLTPDKKGIAKRIREAIASAGGTVSRIRDIRQMRGMSETEVELAVPIETGIEPIAESLDRLSGVAVVAINGAGPLKRGKAGPETRE